VRPLAWEIWLSDLLALMQAAVDAYGAQDSELWLKFVRSRMRRGKSIGDLHWRASKALHEPDAAFTEGYFALQAP